MMINHSSTKTFGSRSVRLSLLSILLLCLSMARTQAQENAGEGGSASTSGISDRAALVENAPAINGYVEGDIQQNAGQGFSLNSGGFIEGNWYVPGSPHVNLNGTPDFQGVVEGSGSSQPSGYWIHLNQGSRLGNLHTRTNPQSLEPVPDPPGPNGNRWVTVNGNGDPQNQIGDWSTVNGLTANAGADWIEVPPGHYGRFMFSNSGKGIILGSSSGPTAYSFTALTLNANTRLQLAGPVVITLRDQLIVNSGCVVGEDADPDRLQIRISRQGLTLNSQGTVAGHVFAPNGNVTLNGRLTGTLQASRLTINSQGSLISGGSADPPPLSVILSRPEDASPFSPGDTIPIEAELAGHSDGAAVGFYADDGTGAFLLAPFRESPPWTYNWIPESTGSFDLFARVIDGDQTLDSDPVTIQVEATSEEPVPDPGDIPVAVHVKNGFNINSQGMIVGSVLQNMPQNTTLNAHAIIDGDLYMPGSPQVKINGNGHLDGTIEGTGNPSPSQHRLTLNANARLDFLRTRTDAIPLPEVQAPSAPQGNRSVHLNQPGQDPGDFSTIRNLTLNANAGTISVPPGAYDTFTANSQTGLILGVEGSDSRTVYEFNRLNLNSHASLELAGPVLIRLGQGTNINSQVIVGHPDHPEWLVLEVERGHVDLNSHSRLYGRLLAPDSHLRVNSQAELHGHAAVCDLTVNSHGLINYANTELDTANTPPQGTFDPVEVPEDADPIEIDLFAAFTDAEDDSADLTFAVATNDNPDLLTAEIDEASGLLTLTLAENQNGSAALTIRATDTGGLTGDAFLSLTVTPVNDSPTADALTLETDEDTALSLTLTGRDVEPGPLTFSLTTDPAHGEITGTAPNLTYTPADNYAGTDAFTFSVSDSEGASGTATVEITIAPVNDAPVAEDQSLVTDEDVSLPLTLTGSDVEDSNLTFSITGGPQQGTLTGSAPDLTYTPAENFNGTDSISFTVNDGELDSAPATITITVDPVNDPPAAVDLNATTDEDTPVAIILSGSDVEGEELGYTVTTAPAHGTLSGLPPTLTYTPQENFNGTDTFTYTVNDSQGDSASATVEIIITPVNDAPVAGDQDVFTDEDTALTITLSGSDVDEDTLTYAVVDGPQQGTLSGSAPHLTYTPAENFHGTDTFTFTANDGTVDSAPATITITVDPVNDPPVADAQDLSTDEDTPLAITLTGSDIDGDTLAYTVPTAPQNGTLSGSAPDLTYTPAPNFEGSDSFTYAANDGTADSSPATVTITVIGVNDPPTITLTDPGQDAVYNLADTVPLAASADDIDDGVARVEFFANDQLIGQSSSEPYAFDWSGFAAGTYTLRADAIDASGASVSSTPVTITVNAPPTVTLDSPLEGHVFNEGSAVPLSATASDTDGDIVHVRFYGGNSGNSGTTLLSEDTEAPYTFSWENLTPGTYEIEATALDNNGAVAQSGIRSFRINALPTISIDSPADGTEFEIDEEIAISLNVFDAEGDVDSVKLFADDGTTESLIAELNSAPFESTWTPTDAGSYSLRAEVVDSDSATANSDPVNLTIIDPFITLSENSNFLTVAEFPVTIPENPESLIIEIADLQFDITDPVGINDALEISLFDTEGNPLSATIGANRSTFFNVTEGEGGDLFSLAEGAGYEAAGEGLLVHLDISSLTPQTEAVLTVQLVNNDDDQGTSARLRDEIRFGLLADLPPVAPATLPAAVSQEPIPNLGELSDITDFVTVEFSQTSFDVLSDTLSVLLNLTNTSAIEFDDTLVLVIDSISEPSIQIRGSDGTTPDGKPYFNFSPLIPDDSLGAGESTELRVLEFTNPPIINLIDPEQNRDRPQFDIQFRVRSGANRPPAFTSTPDEEVILGSDYSYPATATDPDADPLTFSLLSGPDGMTIDPDSGLVQWTPDSGDAGAYVVRLSVSDGRGGSADQFYTLQAVEAPSNRPPRFTSVPVVDGTHGQDYAYDADATDADGGTLVYSLGSGPAGMVINSSTGEITWPAENVTAGSYSISLKVTDPVGAFASQSYTLTVSGVAGNYAPIIISTPVTEVSVRNAYEYQVVALEPDGDAITYSLLDAPAGAAINSITGQITWTPEITGDYLFSISASDGRGGSDLQAFEVAVSTANNDPPVITSTPLLVSIAGMGYGYDVDAEDSDGDMLTYELVSSPEGMEINPSTGAIHWEVPNSFGDIESIAVQVTDGFGGVDTQSYELTIRESGDGTIQGYKWNDRNADGFRDEERHLVYFQDFENESDPLSEWDPMDTRSSPGSDEMAPTRYSGRWNQGSPTLTLENLPEHKSLIIELDLYLVGGWNGNNPEFGPDFWGITLDGLQFFIATFMNRNTGTETQSFPDPYPGGEYHEGTGAFGFNLLGTSQDAIYKLRFVVPHEGESASIMMQARNLQSISDEWWGFDNFKVYTSTAPLPQNSETSNGLVYQNDFEDPTDPLSDWSSSGIAFTPGTDVRPSTGYKGLFTNSRQELLLADLPDHDSMYVVFDLYLLRSWDGNYTSGGFGPDYWNIEIDDELFFKTTFTNFTTATQAFPDQHPSSNGAFTGAWEVDTLGFTYRGLPVDSVYRIAFEVPHSAETFKLALFGQNLQFSSDEAWGIDNIQVFALSDGSGREEGLAGIEVYLDYNNNGKFDLGEPRTITQADDPETVALDEEGYYRFDNALAGTYSVREIQPDTMIQTFPANGEGHLVTLNPGDFISRDFGNAIIQDTLADLTVTDLDFSNISSDPQALTLQGTATAHVTNLAAEASFRPFDLTLFEDRNGNQTYEPAQDNFLGAASYSLPVQPGEVISIPVNLAGKIQFATSPIYAFVDSANAVVETDESNNILASNHECRIRLPLGDLNPVLQWKRADFQTAPTWNQVIMTPVVGDINMDGIPDVIVSTFQTGAGDAFRDNCLLRAISGLDGTELWTVTDRAYDLSGQGSLAIGDIDSDGLPEIIAIHENDRIIAFENDGSFKAMGPDVGTGSTASPSITDLEGDGIPEIILGNSVFNHDLSLRWRAAAIGGGLRTDNSFAADIDLDGIQEIIAGPTVYRADGRILWSNSGLGDVNAAVGSAVGNFDSDPFPEIAVQVVGSLYLLEHTGEIIWGPANVTGRGGPPVIADVDNDGEPEIGIAGSSRYHMFETDGSVKWETSIEDFTSSYTGSSVFDFNGDGASEVIYGDEVALYILNGVDGEILWQTPKSSRTVVEMPIVVDVDGDGASEIVAIANDFDRNFRINRGILVYEADPAGAPWVPTRQVWNQHAYSINNINDDLTVPTNPTPSWLDHNTFRLNTFPEGQDPLAAPDLVPSFLRAEVDGSLTTFTVRVGNSGSKDAPSDIQIAFYDGDPENGGSLVGLQSTESTLPIGAFEDVALQMTTSVAQSLNLFVAVDDDGSTADSLNGAVVECIETNNIYGLGTGLVTPNDAPAFDSNPVTLAVASSRYAYQATATDPNSDNLTFRLLAGPEGMVIDPASGLLLWEPFATQTGTADVILKVEDGRGGYDLQIFTLTTSTGNRSPFFVSDLPEFTIAVGQVFEARVSAIDADGDTISYTLADSPEGVTLDSVTGVLSWIPELAQLGDQTVKIIAEDGKGGSDVSFVDLRVDASVPNVAPEITSEPRTRTRWGLDYTYEIRTVDLNGDPITSQLTEGPSGMLLSDVSGRKLLTWQPGADQIGLHSVTIEVTDGRSDPVVQSFTLEVVGQSSNELPLIESDPTLNAVVDRGYEYDLLASDPDGDVLTYALVDAPAGMTIDPSSGNIRWNPTSEQVGEQSVTIEVIDSYGGLASQEFTIQVRSTNLAPVITSDPITDAGQDVTYNYIIHAEDPEGDEMTASLTIAPEGMEITPAGVVTWTPASDDLGSHEVEILITDEFGAATIQNYSLFVSTTPPNQLPTITSEPVEKVEVGTDYQFQVEASDPEGDVIYSILDGPVGLTIDPDTGLISWPASGAMEGDYRVVVAATDDEGAPALLSYTLSVVTNDAPTIQSSARTEVTLFGTYSYYVFASDPDGDPLTFDLITAPEGMEISPYGYVTWNDVSGSVGDAIPVEIQVTDDCGASVTQTFDITLIADTDAPTVQLIRTINIINPGDQVGFQVQAQDDSGSVADRYITYQLQSGGPVETVPLNEGNIAYITFENPGLHDVTGIAVDAAGNTGTATLDVRVLAPSDTDYPFVTLNLDFIGDQLVQNFVVPDALQDRLSADVPGVVAEPIEIKATVQDDNLSFYRLEIAPLDKADINNPQLNDPDYVVLAEGTTTVDDEVVGTVDPSRFANGAYYVRVLAEDVNGQINFQGTVLNIDTDLKLGRLTYAITDLNIDLVGLPIQITRIYDSLEANQSGDFGHGWKMAFREARLEESVPKNPGENLLGLFAANSFKVGDRVTITNPEGRRVGFTFVPDLQNTAFGGGAGLFGTTFKPRFIPDPGVYDRLDVDNITLTVAPDGSVQTYLIQLPFNPDTYRLTTRDGTVYTYSDNGAADLKSIKDRNGNVLSFFNNRITHNSGAEITFERDSQGRITAIRFPSTSNPQPATIRYEYSATGDLIKVTDAAGYETNLSYYQGESHPDPLLQGPRHYLKDIIDPDGNPVALTSYDAEGRLSQITDGEGVTTNIFYDTENRTETRISAPGTAIETTTVTKYDERGNIIESIDERGVQSTSLYEDPNNPDLPTTITPKCQCTTTRTYDDNGNVLSETDPEGGTTYFTYDSFSNLLSETDELGRTTNYSYDSFGQLTQITDADGNITSMSRDASGRVSGITDPLGRLTRFEYENNNDPQRPQRPRKVIRPDGTELSFTYNAFGGVTSATDENGHTQILETDAAGLLTARIDALNQRTEYRYNNRGEVTEVEDALGNVTKFEYDRAGRILKKIDANPDPQTGLLDDDMIYTYDNLGRLETATDALGRTTTRVYRPDGVVEKIIQPDLTEINFEYDNAGRRTAVIDPNGNRTEFTYDGNGRITERKDPRGKIETYTYDNTDNLIQVTDRNGRVRRFQYDNLDRLVKEVWVETDGSIANVIELRYDANGNLVEAWDSYAKFRFLVDNRERLRKSSVEYGNSELFELSYDYYAASEIKSIEDSDETQVYMSYNENNELIGLSWSGNEEFANAAVSYRRNSIGDITEVLRFTNSAADLVSRTQFEFNRASALSLYSSTAYSANGDDESFNQLRGISPIGPIQMTPGIEDLNRERVISDRITQIEHFNSNGENLINSKFDYRPDGSLLREIDINRSTGLEYSYDLTGQVVSCADTYGNEKESYLYDQSGNRINTITTAYSISTGNRVVGDSETTYLYDDVGNLIQKSTLDGVWEYHYDHRNRLVKVILPDGSTSQFDYDLFDRRISNDNSKRGEKRVYYYTGETIWKEESNLSGGKHYLSSNEEDNWLASQRGGEITWFLKGRSNSIIAHTDNEGNIISEQSYSLFGNQQGIEKYYLSYTGREFDEETGLYYYRARYMDPSIGRFITEDPIGFESADFNLYRYAINSPNNYFDPTGLATAQYSKLNSQNGKKLNLQIRTAHRNSKSYRKAVKEAEQRYPKKAGKFECHHIYPVAMGGQIKAAVGVLLPAGYHQLITTETSRQRKVYKSTKKILENVYKKYPLPRNSPCRATR